jgi:four helix bundle protein
MAFAHKKLIVYQKSIQAVALIAVITRRIHSVDAWLANQMRRAAASIALNIAEGTGEFSKAEKARFYRMARRSAFELSAALDVAAHYDGLNQAELATVDALLDEIAAMLTTMTKNLGDRIAAGDTGDPAEPKPRTRPRTRTRTKNE